MSLGQVRILILNFINKSLFHPSFPILTVGFSVTLNTMIQLNRTIRTSEIIRIKAQKTCKL